LNNLFYICNALDDTTRLERGIVTDSPAASRKIFMICQALRTAGVRATVVSLGRGRQDGSGRYFRAKVVRVNGIRVVYLPFLHRPILSELLSLVALLPVIFRLNASRGANTALFYNRLPVYALGIALARLLGFGTALDLEDGETNLTASSLAGIKARTLRWYFDAMCNKGALLACSALDALTSLRPVQCCYGTSERNVFQPERDPGVISVLLGGTVSQDTGAQLLIDAIRILRQEQPSFAGKIQVEISGKGDCIEQFESLVSPHATPAVVVHGRLTDDEYGALLRRTKVGLALKPNVGGLAYTTFPSKVIEFSSNAILVVSTDISDVRKVLQEGALYLSSEDPRELIEQLRWIAENPDEADALALRGARAAEAACSPKLVGKSLAGFFFAAPAGRVQ
jgi:glycosyltransferase involved in cell wall biosynthesis